MKISAPYQWQYNGVTSWLTLLTWCVRQFGAAYLNTQEYEQELRWTSYDETIYFHREEDYAWFMLRWA